MDRKDVYIIGAGIVGCVLAHELALQNYNITIIEKREHVGGNLYDYVDQYGIRVHKYGPHIFHTKDSEIYDYVSNLCNLIPYKAVCGAVIDNKCVPTAFNFKSIDTFFSEERSSQIKAHIHKVFGSQKSATVLELLSCGDALVCEFAQFLYDKDYKLYTAKQWGVSPEEIDKEVFRRVPIRFSYDEAYFEDKYQAMPANGYMELIGRLLNHNNIKLKLKTDALSHLTINGNQLYWNGLPTDGIVVYTGPIDELFNCKYGKLPYRSLSFEWKHELKDSFQDMAVVAYPQAERYTRITEYKKLPYQDVNGTTYAIEYPIPYKKELPHIEPYYPVLTEDSQSLSKLYKETATNIKNLYCCGRLADFKYYDMDQAIKRALELAQNISEVYS